MCIAVGNERYGVLKYCRGREGLLVLDEKRVWVKVEYLSLNILCYGI